MHAFVFDVIGTFAAGMRLTTPFGQTWWVLLLVLALSSRQGRNKLRRLVARLPTRWTRVRAFFSDGESRIVWSIRGAAYVGLFIWWAYANHTYTNQKISSEREAALYKQAEAVKAAVESTKRSLSRPYFTQTSAAIEQAKDLSTGRDVGHFIVLRLINTQQSPAKNIGGRLIILDAKARPSDPPIHDSPFQFPNEVGQSGPLRLSTPLSIPRDTGPALVFLLLRYDDAFTGSDYRQYWYLVWGGAKDGRFFNDLSNASDTEKNHISSSRRATAMHSVKTFPVSPPSDHFDEES